MDRLSSKGLAQQTTLRTNAQLLGRPKYLKRQARRAIQSPTGRPGRGGTAPASDSGPPLRPEHSLRSLARLRTASSTGRPSQNTTSDFDLRLRPGMRRTLAYISSSTSTIRANWDQPTRDARSVRTRKRTEKVRQGTQVNCNTEDRTLYICRTVPTGHVRRVPATFLA